MWALSERGELVTAIYAICANGSVIPPLLVFPRKKYNDPFIRGGPQGCIGKANPSGWSNAEIFVEYLDHFKEHSQCSKENMALLILDNHESHISLSAIDKCRDLGIVLLTIPPRTSHHLQPLDKSVFYPFKTACNTAMDSWNRSHPGKRVTIYDIPQLVNQAQLSALVPCNILSGFEHTGNWPFNPNVFTDEDFTPSNVTDNAYEPFDVEIRSTNPIYLPAETPNLVETTTPEMLADSAATLISENPPISIMTSADTPISATPAPALPTASAETPSATTPATPAQLDEGSEDGSSTVNRPSTSSYLSPCDIRPLPKATPRKKKQNQRRRKGKSQIFTLTPVRNEVCAKENAKLQQKRASRSKKKLFKRNRSKKQKQQIEVTSSDESIAMQLNDSDSDNVILDEEVQVNIGDYVVVKVGVLKCLTLNN